FVVLWRERISSREGAIALVSGGLVAAWAVLAIELARAGSFQPAAGEAFPPLGRSLVLTLVAMITCLGISASLRGLLSRQSSLIRLHLWRFLGLVFLILMARRQLPALFALPAGIGDILIAATAPWIAHGIDTPRGRRRAIIWNLLGMTDLVVAVGLGITTNPGAAHVFNTTPSSEILTRFPMALVPAFLVPLALTLHGVSLWQLFGRKWARRSVERRNVSRGLTGPAGEVWRPAPHSSRS
ncbi:MAG: hypothetical protein ACRD1B_06755, partial [Thermoanaerobaculia bacterium]